MPFEQPNFGQNQEKKKQPFAHQEVIQYGDRQMALVFRTPGDRIEWGFHKYANPDGMIDRILIKTSSGNQYIIGNGFIINKNERLAKRIKNLPAGLPDIIIGQSWNVPGFFNSTSVESVQLKYKIGELGHPMVDEEVNEGNPFPQVEKQIEYLLEEEMKGNNI